MLWRAEGKQHVHVAALRADAAPQLLRLHQPRAVEALLEVLQLHRDVCRVAQSDVILQPLLCCTTPAAG